MKPIKVLVTGAGGFLGGYIARDLLTSGKYEVFSFSRKKYSHLNPRIVQYQGDVGNYTDVLSALIGMDAVIHSASRVGMWGKKDDFYRTNVTGTENILRACQELGIQKCIYTSTPSVAFGNESLCGVNESTPYPPKYLSLYAETKSLAEQKVLAAASDSLATIAIRPHLIFGPGDQNLVPKVIAAAQTGKLKIVGDGKNLVDVTYVENASLAHVKALEKLSPGCSISGKAYFLGQGPVPLWDFINEILKRSGNGVPLVTRKIPFPIAYIIGALFELVFSILRKYDVDPPMTRFIALQLGKSHYYSHQNIEHDLDFTPPFSINEGLDHLFP